MDTKFDLYRKKAVLIRIILFGLALVCGCLLIVWGALYGKSCYGSQEFLNKDTYLILMILFAILFALFFITAILSINIRCGRYKIDAHVLTIYSGLIKNMAWIDEEIEAVECGGVKHFTIYGPGDIPIDIKVNIFTKTTVIYKDEKLQVTNRY